MKCIFMSLHRGYSNVLITFMLCLPNVIPEDTRIVNDTGNQIEQVQTKEAENVIPYTIKHHCLVLFIDTGSMDYKYFITISESGNISLSISFIGY